MEAKDKKKEQPVATRTRKGRKRMGRAQAEQRTEYGFELLGFGREEGMAIIIESQNEGSNQDIDNNLENTDLVAENNNFQGQFYEEEQVNGVAKGRFSPQQQKILMDAVGQFLTINNISYQDFVVILNQKNVINKILRKNNFYKAIAKALPERPLKSCYRFIKRCFNERNRKGQWSKEQEQKLMQLVREGYDWVDIGKNMNRSSQNLYDKYKKMQSKDKINKKQPWRMRQLIQLLLLVNQRVELPFLNQNIKEERDRQRQNNARQCLSIKQHKYNTQNGVKYLFTLALQYINQNIRKIDLQGIHWSTIANKIKGRSIIDCRNKFIQLFQYVLKRDGYEDQKIVSFILQEGVEKEEDVDWRKWREGDIDWKEARNRFGVIKKSVGNRSSLSFRDVLKELKQKIAKKIEKKEMEQERQRQLQNKKKEKIPNHEKEQIYEEE